MEDETDWPAPQVQRVSLSLTRFPLRHDAPSAWDRHSGNSNMILAGRWKTEDGGRMKGVNVGTNGIEGPATAGGGGGVGVSGRYFEWVDGWDGWNASCGLSFVSGERELGIVAGVDSCMHALQRGILASIITMG
jgi:hypothetical protein